VFDEEVDVTEDHDDWVRHAFHVVAVGQGLSTLQNEDGQYKQLQTRIAWRSFQAAIPYGEWLAYKTAAGCALALSKGHRDAMDELSRNFFDLANEKKVRLSLHKRKYERT
jgi:hypothetical protein